MSKVQRIEYYDGDTLLEGYCTYEDTLNKRPAILIAHDWSGRNDFACNKAEKLAEMGYVAFALDMYGKGILADTKDEKRALMEPLLQDRALLLRRMLAAYNTVKQLDVVDTKKIGALGYCFGGLCVLDLARSGADVKGVVSFHGILSAPEGMTPHPIVAKILALHGFNDPMVTPDHVMQFGREMTNAQADWELNIYGGAMHAFTNPTADDPNFGTVYNRKADLRSWVAMEDFFDEVFSA